MIVEAVTIVRAWFEDPTHGVNALLPAIPRFPGHAAPGAILTFADQTENPEVALGGVPGPYPAIGVHLADHDEKWMARLSDDPVVHDAGDGDVGVVARYCTDNVESADAFKVAGYTLRAMALSLRRLMGLPGAAARVANQFQLIEPRGVFFPRMYQKAGSIYTVGAVLVRWGVRDGLS